MVQLERTKFTIEGEWEKLTFFDESQIMIEQIIICVHMEKGKGNG